MIKVLALYALICHMLGFIFDVEQCERAWDSSYAGVAAVVTLSLGLLLVPVMLSYLLVVG